MFYHNHVSRETIYEELKWQLERHKMFWGNRLHPNAQISIFDRRQFQNENFLQKLLKDKVFNWCNSCNIQ